MSEDVVYKCPAHGIGHCVTEPTTGLSFCECGRKCYPVQRSQLLQQQPKKSFFRTLIGGKKTYKPFRKVSKNPWLAKIIRIDTPAGAKQSVEKLSIEWIDTKYDYSDKGRTKRHLLIKSASEAIRRCKAQLKRKHLSFSEHKEFSQIIEIYALWLKKHRLRMM